MSTTRHHINRQRRRQARETRPAASTGAPESTGSRTRTGGTAVLSPPGPSHSPSARTTRTAGTAGTTEEGKADRTRSRRPVGLVVLCALTVLLGGFAGWAHAKAEALRDDPARRNTALTDLARTGEIKGQTSKAVDRLFSYDHTDPGALEKAARDLLTGKAVDQHRTLLADVRKRADGQKAVITTTVTESAVERIDGHRARVLVYADQSSVATAGSAKDAKDAKDAKGAKDAKDTQDEGVYAGAMLAVDVVHRDGRWLVSGIDTFGR
jgi:Mce-associated membrane protein